MNIQRFRQLLDAYGAAPARWPESERSAAQALLERSAEARQLAAQAARLDELLNHAEAPKRVLGPAALAERIASTPQIRSSPQQKTEWRLAIGWPRLMALAAAAVAGFVVGWSGWDAQFIASPQLDPIIADIITDLEAAEDMLW